MAQNIWKGSSYQISKFGEKLRVINEGDNKLAEISRFMSYKEDFLGNALDTNLLSVIGSGGSTSFATEVVNGVLDIYTGSSDTDRGVVGTSMNISNILESETTFRIRTTSNLNVIYQVGIQHASTPTNHAFYIDGKKVGESIDAINTAGNTQAYWMLGMKIEDLDATNHHMLVDYINVIQKRVR